MASWRRFRPVVRRAAGAICVLGFGMVAAPAGAQDDTSSGPASEVTTTTATTAPSIPPSSTPSTSTTSTTVDPDDPTAGEEAPPATAPEVDATVPSAGPLGSPRSTAVRLDAAAAATAARVSREAVVAARHEVEELTFRLAEFERRMALLDVAHAQVMNDLRLAEELFEDRVAAAVVRGNAAELDLLVAVGDVIELGTANVLLTSIAEGDIAAIDAYAAARDVLEDGVLLAIDAVADTRRRLREARATLRTALATDALMRYRHAVAAAGSDIVIDGFVFPVGRPYNFIDSWGYPRMVGTEYEHGHQGVDIMAALGTPLHASERGIITRVGTDTLGGIKLWLRGESGTDYYYAHLQSYAEGVRPGAVVEAGQVVGFVGDTGNAQGGAPHLHFQLHPDGGAPVNPYPLLRTVADL